MKASDSSFLPSLVGLAFLLAVIVVIVPSANFGDLPRTPEKIQNYLFKHEHTFYFMQGESLAKKVFNSPSARWSQRGFIAVDRAAAAGDQVWIADGTLTMPGAGGTDTNLWWEVIFPADAGTTLYTRVGNVELGDRDKARKAAGAVYTDYEGF